VIPADASKVLGVTRSNLLHLTVQQRHSARERKSAMRFTTIGHSKSEPVWPLFPIIR
jgi:hypothetical protein